MKNKFSTLTIFLSCAGVLAIFHWFSYHTLTTSMCIEYKIPEVICNLGHHFNIYAAILVGFIYGYNTSIKMSLTSIFIPIFTLIIEIVSADKGYINYSYLSDVHTIFVTYSMPIFLISTCASYITNNKIKT